MLVYGMLNNIRETIGDIFTGKLTATIRVEKTLNKSKGGILLYKRMRHGVIPSTFTTNSTTAPDNNIRVHTYLGQR